MPFLQLGVFGNLRFLQKLHLKHINAAVRGGEEA
jgi:hypothetical protein